MFYYLTQEKGYGWNHVWHGPFGSKEELKAATLGIINNAGDDDDAVILERFNFVVCNKRINEGKSIKDSWISVKQKLIDATDSEIKEALAQAFKRCNHKTIAEQEEEEYEKYYKGWEDVDLDDPDFR